MKSLLITFLFSLSLTAGLLAQPLSIDSTFQPFFDIRSGIGTKTIHDIWEDPNSRKLYLIGDFEFTLNNVGHNGMSSIDRNGEVNNLFNGTVGGSFNKLMKRNGDTLLLAENGHYVHRCLNGQSVRENWSNNYRRKSVRCSAASEPYFFPDGSALMSNAYSSNIPDACKIILPPDTFPHRYIVKIDPQGFWDSTFTPDANHHPRGFMPYDSNRIFVYGQPWAFTHYDGVRVNGLCRIYLDGTLDTTFKTPLLSDTFGVNISSVYKVRNIDEKDGSFFIAGSYYLEEFGTDIRFKILKFHADGTIDSSFSTNQNIEHWGPNSAVNDVVSTPDGGYLIAGGFDNYHGYEKYNLVKLDSSGYVETEYFTTKGPDSSHLFGSGIVGVGLLKSNLGGYYVYGNFLKWDGKPTQPIVRLKELTTGIEKNEKNTLEVNIYPNPSKGFVQISTAATLDAIEVYNLQGQKVQEINPRERSWELPQTKGLYLIRLQDKKGRFYTEKVVRN